MTSTTGCSVAMPCEEVLTHLGVLPLVELDGQRRGQRWPAQHPRQTLLQQAGHLPPPPPPTGQAAARMPLD